MATTPKRESVPTLTKGARITGETRDDLRASMVKRYEAGESIRALASEAGRSYGFVHGLLVEAGVELRGRGGATRGEATSTAKKAPAKKAPVKRTATKKAAVPAAATTPVLSEKSEKSEKKGKDKKDKKKDKDKKAKKKDKDKKKSKK